MTHVKNKIDSFRDWNHAIRSLAEKSRQRDRGFDRPVGKLSRLVWPIRERWLLVIVCSICLMDFTTTYINLQLIRNPHAVEAGPLAGWALRTGGFALLLLVNALAAGTLSAIAAAARYFYARSGLGGYARAAFVVILVPYLVGTTAVVINNIALGFF